MKQCPGCGFDNPDDANVCSSCGHLLSEETKAETALKKPAVFMTASLLMVIAAVICLLVGTGKVKDAADDEANDSMLDAWRDHYQECLEGYNDCMLQADYATDWYFKSSYQDIAMDYKEMMDSDQRKIDEIRGRYNGDRITGIIVACLSVPLIGAGAFLSFKKLKQDSRNREWILLIAILAAAGCITLILTTVLNTGNRLKADEVYDNTKSGYYMEQPTAIPKTGNQGALVKANEYLKATGISYDGLIRQLQYEGFSLSEATYAANNCGADWYEQALRKSKDYTKAIGISHDGLIKQLEISGFTHEQAVYAADYCGADWNQQAVLAAKDYAKLSEKPSRTQVIQLLEISGFTHAQAVYGVDHCGGY